ncbi:MAG: hypothetical protein WC781_04070 [Candidatus Pacearchaeota archaeon]|jgi:hypothetical protein
MNKLIIVLTIPLAVLLLASAYAFSSNDLSIRATGNNISYIGNETQFNLSKTSVHLSIWNFAERAGSQRFTDSIDLSSGLAHQGKGTLTIKTETLNKKRIIMNLKISNTQLTRPSYDRLKITGKAKGTYWTKETGLMKVSFDYFESNFDLKNKVADVIGGRSLISI